MDFSLRNLLKCSVFLFIILLNNQVKAQYCIPDFGMGPYVNDYIDGVELGDISNFTGMGDEYNDYTDLSTLLEPGAEYTMTLWNTPSYTEFYAAWIDWDQNEVFSIDEKLNPTDLVLAPGASGEITFTVPAGALPGSTRMRVICVYYPPGDLEPCGTGGIYYYGETEDYTINIPSVGAFDIGVTGIPGIASGCDLGLKFVQATITNLGTEPTGTFSVAYQLTDPVLGILPVVTEAYTGAAIPSLGSATYTFTTPANLSNIGTYTLSVYTIYGPDVAPADDTTTISFISIPTISSFPYSQNFEAGAGGWISGGTNSSWELGDPDGTAIIGPPPSTPTSLNSWTTELNDYYNNDEKSYVESPCFDFSDLVLPYIEFDANWDVQLFDDGAKLQYSTDGGAIWNDIGDIGTGENWYNHATCYGLYPNFYIDNYTGWSGTSEGWVHAHHDLAFLSGESSVKFRFVFGSSSYFNFYDGFAFDNLWIGDPFANDIGVINVSDPVSAPYLSAAESVTVTVKNFGTLPKTGFPVNYQVNLGPVYTQTFTGTINPGETGDLTFTTTADLSADGEYIFTTWTSLAGDANPANDTYVESVYNLSPITGSGAWYIYSNITGYEPWYSVSNTAHMNAVFGDGAWTQDYFETVDPVALFSTDNCFIYLEGSDTHAEELEAFLSDNAILIQNWVASGGHLFLNAAPNEGDGMSFLFDDTQLNYPWYTTTVAGVDPTHPVWSGPFTPTTTAMTGGNYGHARIAGTDITPIIVDAFNPDYVIAAEKLWGAGTVLFGGMCITDFHEPSTEAENVRKNMISYLAACVVSDIDVGVQSILAPTGGCGLTDAETITVKIRNFGFLPQTNIPVHYQVDGGTIVNEIYFGTLDVGTSVNYSFTTTADIGAIGEHTIDAWTSLVLDTITSNDSSTITIHHVPLISVFPYVEDWESGDQNGWLVTGGSSTWELGFPDGPAINTPPVATPTSQYSWATGLTALYNNGEMSYLESPCFDLTSLVLPYLEFDLWWETEDFWDGMQLQYTTDGGATWNILGDLGTGDNWYANSAVALDGGNGWVGNGPGWVTAHHDITFLAGESSVQFRFYFAADGIINFDGIGLDNFRLQDPFPDDVGVSALISPVSGAELTASETVTVNIHNYGTLPQSGFTVSYTADAGAVVTELFTGTVLPGSDAIFTFAATADLSVEGLHEICAWTNLAGDDDVTNDSIPGCQTVLHLLPISGTGSYYIYSSEVGFEPGWLNSNSDAMDAVFGEGVWTLDYYESIDPFALFNESNCFIFLEASEYHWTEFESFFDNNKDLIQGWVSSGGNLFINASPYEGDGGEIGFGGVSIAYPYYTFTSEVADAAHPVFSGPFTPVSGDFVGFYVGNARTLGDVTPIIQDAYCDDCYVLSEKNWGEGRVIFGNMNAPEYYSPSDEAQNLRQNIIDYLKLCSPVDIGATAIVSPESGCGLTNSELITIEMTNFGPTTVTNIPVKYQLDFGTVIAEIVPGPLNIGGTLTYTFDATADFSAAVVHHLEVWTDFSGDADVTNDLWSADISSLETPEVELGPNNTVCDITTLDAGNPGSTYLWSTGETTQTIDVTVSGTYEVTVTNPLSGCAVTDAVTVTVNYTPVADFTYTIDGNTINFTNASTDGASFNWSFGDGTTSTEISPSHTYTTPGTYTVTLTVINGCGSDFISVVIEVTDAVYDQLLAEAISLFPNPTADITYVSIQLSKTEDLDLNVYDAVGQLVWTNHINGIQNGSVEIDMSGFSAGTYQLKICSSNAIAYKQLLLTK